jgi:preprotein translocase subunit SecD
VSANLQGYKTNGEEVTREEMDLAAGVIRQRVDSLGVTEPEIQIQGDDQVVVNIPVSPTPTGPWRLSGAPPS